jgi:hypothetical protein
MVSHSLHAPLHKKALLGGKGQYVLWIDDPRAGGLQTNSNVIMPSHDDLTLTIQGNSAWTTGDFDLLTHSEQRVPLHADRHDQARGDGRQDSWSSRMDLEHQPAVGWCSV